MPPAGLTHAPPLRLPTRSHQTAHIRRQAPASCTSADRLAGLYTSTPPHATHPGIRRSATTAWTFQRPTCSFRSAAMRAAADKRRSASAAFCAQSAAALVAAPTMSSMRFSTPWCRETHRCAHTEAKPAHARLGWDM
eukprot:192401-Chlamydomonas_euryale.AAC.1